MYLGEQASGQQGMSPKIEKVISDSDRGDFQYRREQGRQLRFKFVARRNHCLYPTFERWRRQRFAIELAVRGHGELFQRDEV